MQIRIKNRNGRKVSRDTSLLPKSEEAYKIRTMSRSIREGYFGGLSQTLNDQFMTPYAISLHVSPTQMGILRSLLGILPPIGQIIGSNLMKKKTRRSLVLFGVLLQLLIWPLIIILGFLALNNWILSVVPIFFTMFYITQSFFGAIAGPSWFSLMGDIVPEDHRGRYFSKRNLLITIISIIVSIIASILLEQLKILENVYMGFFIIFSIAFLSRIVSALYLARHYYPSFNIEKHSYMSLRKFFKNIFKTNFGIFTLYMTFITFSVNIGVPFMGYYMLEDLRFTYIEYVAVNLSTPLISIAFYPLIGYITDKYGNALLMRICGFMLPTLPILWIFLNNPLQLIFIPQFISAFAWTGVNLGAWNFIYDNIPKQQRGFYVAYFNFSLGMGVLFGGMLGSFLLQIVPVIFFSVYQTLFLISGILRLFFDFIFLFRIKEVRVKN